MKSSNKTEGLKMSLFFYAVWDILNPKTCSCCNARLPTEPNSACLDHLLEKSSNPLLKYCVENIFVVCADCHAKKTNGFPHPIHKQAIEDFSKKYLENPEYFHSLSSKFEEEIINPLYEYYVKEIKS